jgi:hypothetical protein
MSVDYTYYSLLTILLLGRAKLRLILWTRHEAFRYEENVESSEKKK